MHVASNSSSFSLSPASSAAMSPDSMSDLGWARRRAMRSRK